jgi:hypothetical protein
VSCRSDGHQAWSGETGVPETIKGNVIHMDTQGCDPGNMAVEMAVGWVGYPVALVTYKHGQAP